MSAKDVVRAREQSKRRPAKVPFEQSIHKRKPAKPVETEPIVDEVSEPTVDDAESTGEDVF